MGLFNFSNKKLIPKVKLSSLDTVAEKFNPENNQKPSVATKENFDNAKSKSKYIKDSVDKLRAKLYAENKKLASLERLDTNMSEFLNELLEDPELIGPNSAIMYPNTSVTGQQLADDDTKHPSEMRQLKIIELFCKVFEKYDSSVVNKLIIKMTDPKLKTNLMKDIKDVIKKWRGQSTTTVQNSASVTTLNSYEKDSVFAEKIIEASDKYDWPEEYKEAIKSKETEDKDITQYTVKAFDLKGDDLMTMFLTNPIIEKLLIDNTIIAIHMAKDAVVDLVKNGLENLEEESTRYEKETKKFLKLLTSDSVKSSLKNHLSEPAKDENGNPLSSTEYDEFMKKVEEINSIPDGVIGGGKVRKNKMLQRLLENTEFYITTTQYSKGATNDFKDLVDRNPDIIAKLGKTNDPNKYDESKYTEDDIFALYGSNRVKRKVNIFPPEMADILFASIKKLPKTEKNEFKDVIYNMCSTDPSLLGLEKEDIDKKLKLLIKQKNNDYTSDENTPLEQKNYEDAEDDKNKKHAKTLKRMKEIEASINSIGSNNSEKQCKKKSGESAKDFIDRINTGISTSFTKIQNNTEDLGELDKLIKEYEEKYNSVKSDEQALEAYEQYMNLSVGRAV